MQTQFISNSEHYSTVLANVPKVKKMLWIGTADIKDLYVKQGLNVVPFLQILSDLVKRGVEIRLLHAKEPGQNFRADFDKYPALFGRMERSLCPRVHFKIMIFDLETAYIGSANLTGAGIGIKSDNKRNFEAGIFTADPALVENAIEQFDSVWRGDFCKKCGRKDFCGDKIK